MARQLVEEMTGRWDLADFKDAFRIQAMKLVEKKARAGEGHTVLQPEEEAPAHSTSEVIDPTALLRRSLKAGTPPARPAARKTPSRKKAAQAACACAVSATPAGVRTPAPWRGIRG